MRLPESGRGAPCGRPSQGITPRTVQIVVRYRKFSTSLATGGRFLGRKKKVGAPLVGALPPLWAPFVGYFGVRIKMRLPCRINNVVCLSSNRCGIVLRAPCPRSSVDRASASGAGSTGSNPVGGTFWRSETLSLLFFYLLRPSTKQVLLRRTLDRTRRRVHRVRPRITADDRRRAALAALTHHQRRR